MKIEWKSASESDRRILRSIFLLVGSEPRLLEFLFEREAPRIRQRAGVLRDEARAFGPADELTVRVALDLWCGGGHVQVWELLEGWDAENWTRFIRAVGELKELPAGTIC